MKFEPAATVGRQSRLADTPFSPSVPRARLPSRLHWNYSASRFLPRVSASSFNGPSPRVFARETNRSSRRWLKSSSHLFGANERIVPRRSRIRATFPCHRSPRLGQVACITKPSSNAIVYLFRHRLGTRWRQNICDIAETASSGRRAAVQVKCLRDS